MFLSVTRRCATGVAALALLAPATAQARRHHSPTRAQIRTAIDRALRSKTLWATVNICDTAHHPDVIGIRGEMPALGFGAALSMRIQVNYLASGRFKPDPGAAVRLALGSPTSGSQQGAPPSSSRPQRF